MHEVLVDDDAPARAAEVIAGAIGDAVAARGGCLLVLSGGRSPLPLFARLAVDEGIPWPRVHLLWADERFVPHDHPDSNFGAARAALVDRVGVPPENVHPWPIADDPERSARLYADRVRELAGPEPRFDVTLLGLGADGHTASLFPGSPALGSTALTVATAQPETGSRRLSLTFRSLNGSDVVVFLVTGEEKRTALSRLLAGGGAGVDELPARGVEARSRLIVVTDLDV
jgi:6-phosphogluconolactonase